MSREFLQLDENLFVIPHAVAAVKRSSLEDEACTIFLKGQSSQDGFVVQAKAEAIVEDIEEALAAEEDGE
jgi:hypothetical protein